MGPRHDLPPAHRLLRQYTAQAHANAENLPCMRALIDGSLDEPAYRAILQAHRSVYRGFEHNHKHWLATLQGWSYQPRLPLLDADLGTDADVTNGGQPDDGDEATLWGMLYVIEGATLGARVIVRHLRQCFPGRAHHFFSHGPGPDAPWRAFQSLLDARLPDAASQRRAIDGALAMFAQLTHSLERTSC